MSPALRRALHLSRSTSGIGLLILLAWQVVPWRSRDSVSRLHRVEMRSLTFQPVDLRVAPGDTVVWLNHDIVPHTVTATNSPWDSGEVPPGGEFVWVAGGSGSTSYVCRYHPAMTGTVKIGGTPRMAGTPRPSRSRDR